MIHSVIIPIVVPTVIVLIILNVYCWRSRKPMPKVKRLTVREGSVKKGGIGKQPIKQPIKPPPIGDPKGQGLTARDEYNIRILTGDNKNKRAKEMIGNQEVTLEIKDHESDFDMSNIDKYMRENAHRIAGIKNIFIAVKLLHLKEMSCPHCDSSCGSICLEHDIHIIDEDSMLCKEFVPSKKKRMTNDLVDN